MDIKEIAKIIKEARSRKGWSRAQLSVASGVDYSIIARVEKGQRAPNQGNLKKMLSALTDDEK